MRCNTYKPENVQDRHSSAASAFHSTALDQLLWGEKKEKIRALKKTRRFSIQHFNIFFYLHLAISEPPVWFLQFPVSAEPKENAPFHKLPASLSTPGAKSWPAAAATPVHYFCRLEPHEAFVFPTVFITIFPRIICIHALCEPGTKYNTAEREVASNFSSSHGRHQEVARRPVGSHRKISTRW